MARGIPSFEVKILAAPGNRKEIRRQELAEDVAGFAFHNKYAIFWIADGAPGAEIRSKKRKRLKRKTKNDYFGSRIIARYMGEGFKEVTKNAIRRMRLEEEYYENIFKEALDTLKQKIERKMREEDILNYLKEKADKLPKDHAENCYLLNWSVSFIAAIVNLESFKGVILTSGDCICVWRGEKYEIIERHGRIFVKWRAPANEIHRFNIKIAEKHDFVKIDKIKEIALMSDGVASKYDVERIIKRGNISIIEEISKKTDDDKTLIVFKIEGDGDGHE